MKKRNRKKTDAGRPRQVTTGYVVWWDDDYMSIEGERRCCLWDPDKKAAVKLPRATAFAIVRQILEEWGGPDDMVRVLRRYKVVA